MAKKAGEFYVNLGLKGDDDTQRKLDKQTDYWKNIKGASTEAKLAILAVLYGVERMVSTYGAAGNELVNFTTITDISRKKLQAYEIQAQKAGAANGELTTTFDNLQKQMFGVMTGSGVPPWLATITGTLQGMGVQFTDAEKKNTAQAWGQNPDLFFQRINQFANNKLLDKWKTTNVLREMGFSDNIVAGMMRHFFDPSAIKGAESQVWSDKTVENLAKLNSEWVNLLINFKQFMGTLAGSDLTKFVKDLSGIAHQLERIGGDLNIIGKKAGALGFLSDMMKTDEKVLGGLADILEGRKGGFKNLGTGLSRLANPVGAALPSPQTINHYTTRIEIIAKGEGKKMVTAIGTEVKEVMKSITNLYSAKASH